MRMNPHFPGRFPNGLPMGLVALLAWIQAARADEDLLIADFESESYAPWIATGEAFGPGPASGTLPNQMPVSGYAGTRLVNSYRNGDGTTGTLTSPEFTIERDFITFLIGGGGHANATCMHLIVRGQVVRTATGPNTRAGGSEALEPSAWDVRELRGQKAVLRIVDEATGGWGHINVDQIAQTDHKPNVAVRQPRERPFTVGAPYLVLPIQNGARGVELALRIDDRPVRQYTVELAPDAEHVDWHAFLAIDAFRGKSAVLAVDAATEAGFALIRESDAVPGASSFYTEPLRPQFHFSQRVGWNNDPNGMVYVDGEWHLFFQHNPVGWRWGNMTWGHAVSEDLVHWRELPDALFPRTMAKGDCFSGGAVVDRLNTAGWKQGEHDTLVAFLTDTGAGESIAYSTDRGRSFTWFEGNPVVRHAGRDPKVIWYAYRANDSPLDESARRLGGHWVMAVYDEDPRFGRAIAFHTSTDLKTWREQSRLVDYFECPEIFELPIEGEQGATRWVVFAADARYAVGQFDGKTFLPEHEGKHRVHHGAYYASQTFSDAPDGRRIQVGWAQIEMPGMPFNQTFGFPHALTLHRTSHGLRMRARPIAEIERLVRGVHTLEGAALDERPASLRVTGELFDVRASFELGKARTVGLEFGGNRVVYDASKRQLDGADLEPIDGRVTLRVLIDRPMLEIGGNGGTVVVTRKRERSGAFPKINAFAEGGGATLLSLEVRRLASIWEP
ncbi:MAG: glycoside hydrolase family 32 protein [Planctomycetes bacterium]|nr:glycoside hydrolase family 32 protein [Planctomycetota bacterium]